MYIMSEQFPKFTKAPDGTLVAREMNVISDQDSGFKKKKLRLEKTTFKKKKG